MSEAPPIDRKLLRPGMRVAVAVSGGADSVALLRRLMEAAPEIGLVLSVAHVHHGIRGTEADADAGFVSSLAAAHGLGGPRQSRDHRRGSTEPALCVVSRVAGAGRSGCRRNCTYARRSGRDGSAQA